MCTCISFSAKDNYFGRNMDIDCRFGERVVITPRGYDFRLKSGDRFNTLHAMIGMAAVADGYPLYAEAANEKGLAMAGLYFPGNACYSKSSEGKLNLAPYELIPYFLGLYSTVEEVIAASENLSITDVPFSEKLPVSALHWMISDADKCIVMEQTENGLKLYSNPVKVLTNNPPFEYHLNNLNNYMHLTPCCPENSFSSKIALKAYGQGMGAIGLPGDNSPASRFVRAAFNKLNSDTPENEECAVAQFFHILDSAAMVKGSTLTEAGRHDYTTYSCCINTTKGIYYYKTYYNNQITAVKMGGEEKTKAGLTVFPLSEAQQIRYE